MIHFLSSAGSLCAIAHRVRHLTQAKSGMNTQPDAEPLPVAAAKSPEVTPFLKNTKAIADIPLRCNVPILDADFNYIVPGYSDADAWYEP